MPKRSITVALAAAALVVGGAIAWSAASGGAPSRQQVVADRGAQVMPFSLDATTHVFAPDAQGGTQRVIAKDRGDGDNLRLIREHLREEADAFRRGDFADPSSIHGNDMPGLADLRGGYRNIDVRYRELPDGAEIAYRTGDGTLVAAVGAWFAAQLGDHGDDAAMAGHSG